MPKIAKICLNLLKVDGRSSVQKLSDDVISQKLQQLDHLEPPVQNSFGSLKNQKRVKQKPTVVDSESGFESASSETGEPISCFISPRRF